MSVNDTPPTGGATRRRRRSKTLRRISGSLALLFGLTAMALIYASVFTPKNDAQAANLDAAQIAEGKSLYQTACITCHGCLLYTSPSPRD